MNSFSSALSGLFSSLLLSLGFSGLAARFDHLHATTVVGDRSQDDHASAFGCVYPCRWQEV